MKAVQWIFLFVLIMFIQACHCEFAHFDCYNSDDSQVKLDDESYRFLEENFRTTTITENDSLIFIDYSISRKGNNTGSNFTIDNGFFINLVIRKISDDQFVLKSGSVELIKNDVRGDIYGFESHHLNLIGYEECECQKEINNPIFTPKTLKLKMDGVISNGTAGKSFEFDLQFETKKVEVRNC